MGNRTFLAGIGGAEKIAKLDRNIGQAAADEVIATMGTFGDHSNVSSLMNDFDDLPENNPARKAFADYVRANPGAVRLINEQANHRIREDLIKAAQERPEQLVGAFQSNTANGGSINIAGMLAQSARAAPAVAAPAPGRNYGDLIAANQGKYPNVTRLLVDLNNIPQSPGRDSAIDLLARNLNNPGSAATLVRLNQSLGQEFDPTQDERKTHNENAARTMAMSRGTARSDFRGIDSDIAKVSFGDALVRAGRENAGSVNVALKQLITASGNDIEIQSRLAKDHPALARHSLESRSLDPSIDNAELQRVNAPTIAANKLAAEEARKAAELAALHERMKIRPLDAIAQDNAEYQKDKATLRQGENFNKFEAAVQKHPELHAALTAALSGDKANATFNTIGNLSEKRASLYDGIAFLADQGYPEKAAAIVSKFSEGPQQTQAEFKTQFAGLEQAYAASKCNQINERLAKNPDYVALIGKVKASPAFADISTYLEGENENSVKKLEFLQKLDAMNGKYPDAFRLFGREVDEQSKNPQKVAGAAAKFIENPEGLYMGVRAKAEGKALMETVTGPGSFLNGFGEGWGESLKNMLSAILPALAGVFQKIMGAVASFTQSHEKNRQELGLAAKEGGLFGLTNDGQSPFALLGSMFPGAQVLDVGTGNQVTAGMTPAAQPAPVDPAKEQEKNFNTLFQPNNGQPV